MPKISVIVPVYKVEAYLARCVESIFAQSVREFELILVDDGSPDLCGAMCDAYARQDDRVHVIHQNNGGLSAARNAGIDWVLANSDSQWLTFIDSDDWVHPEYLRMLLEAACQHDASIAMCNLVCTDGRVEAVSVAGRSAISMEAEEAYITHYEMCMTACCKIYAKELFHEVRFPVGKLHEDAFVTHKLLFAARRAAICEEALYYYFSNPNSITRVKWSPRRLDQIEAHAQRYAFLQDAGYSQAAKRELEAYTTAVFAQAQDLRLLSKEERSYREQQKQMHRQMMPVFRMARKQGLFPFAPDNVWMYELAYPVKPVWIARNLLEKLLKR